MFYEVNNKPEVTSTTFHVSRFTLLALTLTILLVAAACTSGASGEEPPVILYGQDVCDRCGMIIDEPRFAAAYVTPQGDVRRFDDIGDMVAHYQAAGEEVAIFWVHDYVTEVWLKANDAFFVVSDGLITPMGSGIAASADGDGAGRLVDDWGGRVLTFEALLAEAQTRPAEAHHHHEHALPHGHDGQ